MTALVRNCIVVTVLLRTNDDGALDVALQENGNDHEHTQPKPGRWRGHFGVGVTRAITRVGICSNARQVLAGALRGVAAKDSVVDAALGSVRRIISHLQFRVTMTRPRQRKQATHEAEVHEGQPCCRQKMADIHRGIHHKRSGRTQHKCGLPEGIRRW